MDAVFDTALVLAHRGRALARNTQGADFLMRRVCEDLAERLDTTTRRFPSAATVFCTTAEAAGVLAASGKTDQVLRVEADQAMLAGKPGIVAPFETIPPHLCDLDLAVSLLALQEMNDVPGMLVQLRRALKPDGLFLGAMAGGATLTELRQSLLAAEVELFSGASPRVAPFADVRDVGGLLQRAGFALPVADTETVTVRYGDMFSLMADLRAMGATNALVGRSRRPISPALFIRAAQIYAERHSDPDGRLRATFEIIWMSGWAPDPSQQRPLEPGSAEVSLAEALKRSEVSWRAVACKDNGNNRLPFSLNAADTIRRVAPPLRPGAVARRPQYHLPSTTFTSGASPASFLANSCGSLPL